MPEPVFENPNSQQDWRALVHQAEERINALSASLNDLRSVVNHLAVLAIESPAAQTPIAPPQPRQPEHDALSAGTWPTRLEERVVENTPPPPAHRHEDLLAEKPQLSGVDFSNMLRDDGWGAPAYEAPRETEPDPLAAERDEVRRAVEAARAELEAAKAAEDWSLPQETEEPAPAVEEEPVAEAEVAEAEVEEPVATSETEIDPDEAAREEVRRAVERARSEMSFGGAEEPSWPTLGASDEPQQQPSEPLDPREEVRRAVEQARAEMDSSRAAPAGALWPEQHSGWPGSTNNSNETPAANSSDEDEGDEDEQEAVRRLVEQARAEMEAGVLRLSEIDVDSEEQGQEDGPSYAERDEVRRTVALARAEMELNGADKAAEGPHADLMAAMAQPRRASWEAPTIDEAALMPPVMVIEDTDRHVELARVYELLDQLQCAQQASLLNYASRNVSIGFSSRDALPQQDAIRNAVKIVFGRECKVSMEGNRLSIIIGESQGRAA